jgi:hypothetical protein
LVGMPTIVPTVHLLRSGIGEVSGAISQSGALGLRLRPSCVVLFGVVR